jgi:hypothetical protein
VKLPAEIDWRVLALSTAICLFAALFMGFIPALQARRVDLSSALKTESVGVIGGGRAHLRSLFVLVQVALSFVLLVGTALLVRSVREIRNTSPGFATSNLVATSIDFVSAGYDVPRTLNFEDELVDRLRGVSGVQSVAFSRVRPFTYIGYSSAPNMTTRLARSRSWNSTRSAQDTWRPWRFRSFRVASSREPTTRRRPR